MTARSVLGASASGAAAARAVDGRAAGDCTARGRA